MMKEFNFSFDELVIDHQLMAEVMGYGDGPLPEPFKTYLEEVLKDATVHSGIRAAYKIVDDMEIDQKRRIILAEGKEFKVGKTVCDELTGSERLAFFVCTAGKTISEKSVNLLQGEDPVKGYIYDLLGSAIAEAAGEKIQSFVNAEAEKSGEKITNRYSPGYCHWSVEDQHKLFSVLGNSPCGVTLTQSSLMQPVKSISGIIGIGHHVKYREYQCTLCNSENCVYRRVRGL